MRCECSVFRIYIRRDQSLSFVVSRTVGGAQIPKPRDCHRSRQIESRRAVPNALTVGMRCFLDATETDRIRLSPTAINTGTLASLAHITSV